MLKVSFQLLGFYGLSPRRRCFLNVRRKCRILILLFVLPVSMYCRGPREVDSAAAEPAEPGTGISANGLKARSGSVFMKAEHVFIPFDGESENSAVGISREEALDKALEIRSAIGDGTYDFHHLAEFHASPVSGCEGEGILEFTPGAVAHPLDSAVSGLSPGEVSGVVESRFGFHILKRL